jgi:hypothetical protein
MKKLLILATMLLTFGFANAQCKIYEGKYASGTPIAVYEGGKIYQGKYASGTPVGVIEGGKVYQGKYASGTPIATTEGGGGQCAFAAAAYLLLL